MNKNRLSKYLILLAVTTFLASFFFIVQTSYSKLMNPIREAQNSPLAKPINPQLDTDTLDLIESRIEYPEAVSGDNLFDTPTPTPLSDYENFNDNQVMP